MNRALLVVLASTLLVAVASTGVAAGTGVTRIAPSAAEAGHPFTLIDTGLGRLVDGSVAVFELDGRVVTIALHTHKPYNTAQGRLPGSLGGGTYAVSVRRPDGTEFDVGPFVVIGPPTVAQPSISPVSGPIGTTFTITDPLGRMAWADTVVFTLEGNAPIGGTVIPDVVFSSDGTTATGTVPSVLAPAGYSVTVHTGDRAQLPLFNALVFHVT